jgi:hypothetical protein
MRCNCYEPKNFDCVGLYRQEGGEVRIRAQCPYCGADGLLVKGETTPQHIAWAREWDVPWIGIDPELVEALPD